MTEEENKELEDDLEGIPEVEPEPEVEAEPDPEREEIETEARKYGWKPKDDFTLAPDGWVDADRFLELPSTRFKMQKDLTRELEEKLRERDEKLSRLEAMSVEAVRRVRDQERQEYESRLARIEDAKRRAAEEGDLDRYDALSKQQQTIKPPQEADPTPQPRPRPPELEEYRATEEGRWMNDPHAVSMAAQAIAENKRAQLLPPIKQAQWASQQIKEYFPEYFQTEERPKPKAVKVDPGGLAGGRRGKGADELPADVRRIGQEFVAEGVFKSLDEYAKSYFAQEAR